MGPDPGSGPLSGDKLTEAVSAGVRAIVADEQRKQDPMKSVIPRFSPRDIELGLAPGAELAMWTRDRVRRSRAPNVGRALLEYRIDAAGIIGSVRVVDVSSGWNEWEQVAAEVARDARTAPPIRMPSGTKGLAVTVEVTSDIKTVSGRTPTDKLFGKIVNAITDPLDAVVDGRAPPQRVVAARIVTVDVL
jgi:TonB family protein